MSNHMKKHGFPVTVERLFTRPGVDAYKMIHFREREQSGDDFLPALECPDNWSAESTALLADEAAFKSIQANKKPIEENTVPSWLWQHKDAAKRAPAETSVRHIFNRVVGAATYTGWQEGIFTDEVAAHSFFDEARYALAQRFIAINAKSLASLGLSWAYGITSHKSSVATSAASSTIEVPNTLIDSVVSGSRDKASRAKWQKITHAQTVTSSVDLRFADVAAEWEATPTHQAHAAIDLMACRHNDGAVNIAALRQLTRILVFLFDLHDVKDTTLAIGFTNLAPLLMALALPYDSDAARATTAAIGAIITAEAYAASAELAASRGASPVFADNRERTLRALRNHRRAAYGERNDYEKISVLPVPLDLESCTDLALAAAARSTWDDALQLAQNYGLRATQFTTLTASPALSFFMESVTHGLDPMRNLTIPQVDADTTRTTIHPSVTEGLSRLRYTQPQIKAIVRHVTGHGKLDKAPGINHVALKALKFDKAAIEHIENYLSQATSLRFAFTPWVVGEKFCRDVLKISARDIQNPRFDILGHLGFTKTQIAAANAYCYGHGDLKGVPELHAKHANLFACEANVSPEARVRMASALQGFVSGSTGLHLSLPLSAPTEKIEKLLLTAWRQGVRSLTLSYDAVAPTTTIKAPQSHALARRKSARKIKPSAFVHAKAPSLPVRKSKSKSGHASVATRGKSKSSRRNWVG